MTYTEKLKDPRWQKKRLEIMERDKWACRICGDRLKNLHVHHVFYMNGKEPWEHTDEFMVTLCCDCHEWQRVV